MIDEVATETGLLLCLSVFFFLLLFCLFEYTSRSSSLDYQSCVCGIIGCLRRMMLHTMCCVLDSNWPPMPLSFHLYTPLAKLKTNGHFLRHFAAVCLCVVEKGEEGDDDDGDA